MSILLRLQAAAEELEQEQADIVTTDSAIAETAEILEEVVEEQNDIVESEEVIEELVEASEQLQRLIDAGESVNSPTVDVVTVMQAGIEGVLTRLPENAGLVNHNRVRNALESVHDRGPSHALRAAVEEAEDAKKSIWQKIKDFFSWLGEKIKNFWTMLTDKVARIRAANNKLVKSAGKLESSNFKPSAAAILHVNGEATASKILSGHDAIIGLLGRIGKLDTTRKLFQVNASGTAGATPNAEEFAEVGQQLLADYNQKQLPGGRKFTLDDKKNLKLIVSQEMKKKDESIDFSASDANALVNGTAKVIDAIEDLRKEIKDTEKDIQAQIKDLANESDVVFANTRIRFAMMVFNWRSATTNTVIAYAFQYVAGRMKLTQQLIRGSGTAETSDDSSETPSDDGKKKPAPTKTSSTKALPNLS